MFLKLLPLLLISFLVSSSKEFHVRITMAHGYRKTIIPSLWLCISFKAQTTTKVISARPNVHISHQHSVLSFFTVYTDHFVWSVLVWKYTKCSCLLYACLVFVCQKCIPSLLVRLHLFPEGWQSSALLLRRQGESFDWTWHFFFKLFFNAFFLFFVACATWPNSDWAACW